MQLSTIPAKYLVPFAQNAAGANFTELPVTTADPTRASQSLGFPALTMQPVSAGGVPPQGPDVNGGMNQIARIAWWLMSGGKFLYDSTWASNANIGGYPAGAQILSADGNYVLQSRIDNNTASPTVAGTGWAAPGNPGVEFVSPGATVTLTAQQAASSYIRVTGTLAANSTFTLPALPASNIRAPLSFVLAHEGTTFNVILTTGVGPNLTIGPGQRAIIQQRNDGSIFNASANLAGTGIIAPAFAVGAAGAAHGTIGVQGYEIKPNGMIRNWLTMQLQDNATGAALDSWTYPQPFTTVVTAIRGTNLARAAGQLTNAALQAILTPGLPSLTSVALGIDNTASTGSVAWMFVEVEGY